jgi:hypothetical protein
VSKYQVPREEEQSVSVNRKSNLGKSAAAVKRLYIKCPLRRKNDRHNNACSFDQQSTKSSEFKSFSKAFQEIGFLLLLLLVGE